MLLRTKADVENIITAIAGPRTPDIGSIRQDGACRLPAKTADTGKIRLGGACRLPAKRA